MCVLLSKNEPQKTHRKLMITACKCTNIWRKTQTYVHPKKILYTKKNIKFMYYITIQYCSCFKNKLHIQKRAWYLFKFKINSYSIWGRQSSGMKQKSADSVTVIDLLVCFEFCPKFCNILTPMLFIEVKLICCEQKYSRLR